MPIYKVDGVKKDGLQKYSVRINYISEKGQKKQLTRIAYGKTEAQDLERQLSNEIKTKGNKPKAKITVQQLFEEYKTGKQFEIRETSLDKCSRNF